MEINLIALDFSAETMNLIVRLLVSALLGAAIGFERDVHGRAAGLRTHLLVCAGSALFMIISEVAARHFNQGAAGTERSDPTRIAAQVVTGIGFLGAGTILKEGLTIRGLTTAACLWFVAGLGMACGAGLFTLAFYATVLGLFCLISLNYLERTYRKDSYRTVVIQTHNSKTVARSSISLNANTWTLLTAITNATTRPI